VLFLPYTTLTRRVYAISIVTVTIVDIIKNMCLIVEFTKYCDIKFYAQCFLL